MYVVPRSGSGRSWLRRGMNDGAPVLHAVVQRGRIRRGQRGPVDGAIDDAELLLHLHAQLAVDIVTNVGRQQDTFEGRIVGALDEVFSNVPANYSAQFLIDANFVGLTSSSIHGFELNTAGAAAKKWCGFDGMNGVGRIESTENQRNQG